MTVLQALAGYYDRMAEREEVPAEGYSTQPIDFKLVIGRDGSVIDAIDIREPNGKRLARKMLAVPHPQRTSNVMPNFLWDKTAYLFGVTAGADHRTAREHAAFVEENLRRLRDVSDPMLVAFRQFLANWKPEHFSRPLFTEEMRDKNFVVAVEGELRYVHECDEARAMIAGSESRLLPEQLCLVTGEIAPIAELHPVIKNVRGGQSSGGYLVSFNAPAFTSWNAEGGANAPTSAKAVAQYGAALNALLLSTTNRMQIGDATVAFWADTRGVGEEKAAAAEDMLAGIFGGKAAPKSTAPDRPGLANLDEDAGQAVKMRDALTKVAEGRPVELNGVEVEPGTEVHILGLSPNAARLSVRFWLTERLEVLAHNLTRHSEHCRIEPLPRGWGAGPSINVLLVRTVAAQEKWDNIPPLLAGEVARAVLGGTPYPRTLLSNALMRLRAGDDPASGWHAAVIRAVLMRLSDELKKEGEPPVSLDKEETNRAYRLGRLFAVLEEAQEQALGHVNATIRDRYFGAASATPASVFPLLLRGVQNHLGKLRKDNPGAAGGIEIKLGEVIGGLDAELPRSLRLEEQGRFAIGYYHQRSDRFRKREAATDQAEEAHA